MMYVLIRITIYFKSTSHGFSLRYFWIAVYVTSILSLSVYSVKYYYSFVRISMLTFVIHKFLSAVNATKYGTVHAMHLYLLILIQIWGLLIWRSFWWASKTVNLGTLYTGEGSWNTLHSFAKQASFLHSTIGDILTENLSLF